MSEQVSSGKILPFRQRPVKPTLTQMPAGFDHALSRRLDFLVYALEELQAEKHELERYIPTRQATA